jgi:trafficking protein particle complex subunit 2
MLIRCVAVIGKKNDPLYLKTFSKRSGENEDLFRGEEIHYHFLAHTSLDCIEEKVAKRGSSSADPSREETAAYLGLLYYLEDLRLYGYMTATSVKFIVIIETSVEPKDTEIQSIMQQIHEAYVRMVNNVFFPVTDIRKPIVSDRFDKDMEVIVDRVNKTSSSRGIITQSDDARVKLSREHPVTSSSSI